MRATTSDGLLLVDKPAGISSHDVVLAARRSLGERRIGHAGTLDPFATGLLLVLIGRATRVQRFLMALPKTYETVARLGWTSTVNTMDGGDMYRLTLGEGGYQVDGEVLVAGPMLAASLRDLIDEYQIYLHPAVVGGGKTFFAKARPPLRMVRNEPIEGSVIRLTYVPA